ncbi:MAG: NAD(+)/NADH kinase [Actinomycetota bacterium]
MKRAALVLHGDRPEAAECGRWLAEALTKRGVQVFAQAADAERLKDTATTASQTDLDRGFDVMFALGGDGTFLRAAEAAARSDTPLLGVNLGRVGFLAAVERADLESALDRILADGIATTQRMTLDAEVLVDGRALHRLWALNDIGVSKLEPGRLIKLGIAIAGEQFTTVAADGVVVATPTGSTAYSFSSGGPVVAPDVDCLIVTPVSPHLAFDRSVVTGPDDLVEITVLPDPDAVAVSADGRPWIEVPAGAVIRIRRSERRLRIASVDATPFWRLVRTKFRLPG